MEYTLIASAVSSHRGVFHNACILTTLPLMQVEFQDVKMRYRPGLPLVLRGLTVRVEPESRVGVVGRTGAGKSSLINCLFRLMELDSGKIVIDSQDISKMGLHQLRGSMSLIPQVCRITFPHPSRIISEALQCSNFSCLTV